MYCVRRIFDSRTPSLDESTAMLILHEGDIGIHMNLSIAASMKKNVYNPEIVAITNAIMCCKCTCQCGSQNKEQILCVHILPLIFLMSLLLFEDLAEHMLLELSVCMSADIWDQTVWPEEDIGWMKQNMILLMKAAGEPVGKHDPNVVTIGQLLEAFVVGTEQQKKWK